MNKESIQLEIKYIAQENPNSILPDELSLIESVMPDLILAMLQESNKDL